MCPFFPLPFAAAAVPQPKPAEQAWANSPATRAYLFLPASRFFTLHFYIYYIHNTTFLSSLTLLITTVHTSLHWFTSLKHQSSGASNLSSLSHFSHCIFACYAGLRKLVGKRGLKPHKAGLFHSLQFNQNRHGSKTNQQLNFLQVKYWTQHAGLWQAFMTTSPSVANILHLHHY